MFIILITVINLASAIEFDLISPEQVEVGKDFKVTISSESQEIYDIKLFVYETEYNNIKSKIYSQGVLKNPWYYLVGAFPDNKNFTKVVQDFIGETEICLQMRKKGQSTYQRKCNYLKVIPAQIEKKEIVQTPAQSPSSEEQHLIDENPSEEIIFQEKIETSSQGINRNLTFENEKIILTSSTKTPNEKTYQTKENKIRNLMIYSFFTLFSLLIFLILFKKFNFIKKKEDFEDF